MSDASQEQQLPACAGTWGATEVTKMLESTETHASRSVYLRRALIVAAPIVAVISAVRFGLWWGAQSQQAMLRGRRWPPEALMVLLGR